MKIAKPLLLVLTPLGMIVGLHEAYRLAGGFVVLMVLMMSGLAIAFGSLISVIRREQRAHGEQL